MSTFRCERGVRPQRRSTRSRGHEETVTQPPRDPRHRTRSERFALAAEHPATPALRSEFADELAIVAALRRLGAEAAPDTAAGARIHAHILSEWRRAHG